MDVSRSKIDIESMNIVTTPMISAKRINMRYVNYCTNLAIYGKDKRHLPVFCWIVDLPRVKYLYNVICNNCAN